ncbi:MAG: family 16 glycosylhydrolase [Cytophagales bacterium]
MKSILHFVVAFISYATFSQTWIPVWSDEFNYSGLPDENKWSYDVGCSLYNNEAQYYSSKRLKNTRVENGNLIIEAHKENLAGCNYTSGRIVSKNKGDWKYGKFEVRAKFPTYNGSWPAIWFLPTEDLYGSWPKSGEIDLMENVGYEPTTTHYTIHTEAYNHTIGTQKSGSNITNNLADDFHVYTLEWYPDSLRTFMDGTKTFVFKKEGSDYKKWPFDQKFHILLNLAIGGSWGGSKGIDDTKFPMQFLIDYVKVYQIQTNTGPFELISASNTGGKVVVMPDSSTYSNNSVVDLQAIPDSGYTFEGWYSDFYSRNTEISLVMNRDIALNAVFRANGELIKNGDFVLGNRFWSFGSNAPALASMSQTGNITVQTPSSSSPWNVNFQQLPVSIISGHTYKFSFDINTDASMRFMAGLGKSSGDYSTYNTIFETTKIGSQTFSKTFTSSVTDSLARFFFDLGYDAGNVKISNVSLIDLTQSTVDVVDNLLESSLPTFYWNSQKTEILVDFNNSEIEDLDLYDIMGKKVNYRSTSNFNELKLDDSQISLLLIKYKVKNKGYFSYKLIKL